MKEPKLCCYVNYLYFLIVYGFSLVVINVDFEKKVCYIIRIIFMQWNERMNTDNYQLARLTLTIATCSAETRVGWADHTLGLTTYLASLHRPRRPQGSHSTFK